MMTNPRSPTRTSAHPNSTQQEQKRHSRLSLDQQRYKHTPPPEQVQSSPRTGSEKVNVTLSGAFAMEEEQPGLFPQSLYRDRTPSRPRGTASPSPAPGRESASPFIEGMAGNRDRSYSPMAAAFKRLNVKEGVAIDSSERGRASAASMFGGPA